MRITFVLSSLWLSGGNRVVVEFANRLDARGYKVSIVIPRDTISQDLVRELNPTVTIIEASYPLTKKIGWLGRMRLVVAMVQAVPPCDVIISTHTPTTIVSLITGYIFKRGIPVWLYEDYPQMFANRPFERWLLRVAPNWHKGTLVISNHLKEDLSPFHQSLVQYVGLGLSNTQYFKPVLQSIPKKPGSSLNIFYLGDFRLRKGLADFLSAARVLAEKIPEIRLWIATKEPGEICTDLPVQHFLRPSQEQLATLYATCDLFVSASWYEGFGLPPLEAMACGAPVVMTDSGGVRDYARNGENCMLVPPKQPEQLAAAMLRVLEDPVLSGRLRQNGPPTAAQFGWDAATDRFEQALLTICGHPKSSQLLS